MKAILTLSKKFFPAHFRSGEETNFKEKLLRGEKIHTCRMNYWYWSNKISRIIDSDGVLSIRQWSDKPYRSPQEIVKDIPAYIVGVQKLKLTRYLETRAVVFYASVDGESVSIEDLARNDGLTQKEFEAWFNPTFDKEAKNFLNPKNITLTFAIIHFTKQRY